MPPKRSKKHNIKKPSDKDLEPKNKVPKVEEKKEEKKEEKVNEMASINAKSSLEQLKTFTEVVADSSDFDILTVYKATGATTNPTLILKATEMPKYAEIINRCIKEVGNKFPNLKGKEKLSEIYDLISVSFGSELCKILPNGFISTEVDARLSFNTKKTIEKAEKIIKLYEEKGISKDRLLIKIASCWEGFEAAKELEKKGIHCNMTLIFSFYQAVVAAQINAFLISPFVGRILDFYKQKENKDFKGNEDPGVKSVTQIYNYYKKYGIKTFIMGASFRNVDEIIELAGCDKLTISPDLLKSLSSMNSEIIRKLDPEKAKMMEINQVTLNEESFRWNMNQDEMATIKLAEGIRNFAKDTEKLEQIVLNKMDAI